MPSGPCLLAKSAAASRPARSFRRVPVSLKECRAGRPASCEGVRRMTAGWISPRWVPLMVYVVVLAAGLYYAAMGLGGIVPVDRVAGFVAAMTALLCVEAAERRWPGRP